MPRLKVQIINESEAKGKFDQMSSWPNGIWSTSKLTKKHLIKWKVDSIASWHAEMNKLQIDEMAFDQVLSWPND